ncbi:hypothetical protein HanPI659440_Chr10g0383511 [Helianthus annuus]|nr:hypothetical protein HanPI659440_Chr10g0383511 [Helianthus annuus]
MFYFVEESRNTGCSKGRSGRHDERYEEKGSYEDLFKKKIAIYNQICEEMSQNLQAQVQYVQHIQAQNREFLAPSILRITKLLVKVL